VETDTVATTARTDGRTVQQPEVNTMKEALETLFDLIETNCYDWRDALHRAAAAHNVNYLDLWDAYDNRCKQ
jgi:hypothetical protein